jgi:hypothetical protein
LKKLTLKEASSRYINLKSFSLNPKNYYKYEILFSFILVVLEEKYTLLTYLNDILSYFKIILKCEVDR